MFHKFDRKTPVLESLFNKIVVLHACNFIKKRHQHRSFLVKIVKFLKTSILKNICKQLLLKSQFEASGFEFYVFQNIDFKRSALEVKKLLKCDKNHLRKNCNIYLLLLEKHDQWMLARKKKQITEKESRKVLLSTGIDTKTILEKKRKKEQDQRTILKLMEELIRTAENLKTITEEDEDKEEEENYDETNLPTFPTIEKESIENSLTIEPIRTKEREEELIPTTTPAEEKLPPIKSPIENLLFHENENEINSGKKEDLLPKLPPIQIKTNEKKMKHCRKTKAKEEEFTKKTENPIASTQNADYENKVQRLIKKKQRLEYASKKKNLYFPKIEVTKEFNEEKEDERNIKENVEEKLEDKNEENYEPPKYLEVDLGKPHIVQQLVLEVHFLIQI